jgi:hypothetical protein
MFQFKKKIIKKYRVGFVSLYFLKFLFRVKHIFKYRFY